MKEFFQKYAVELDETDALELICDTITEIKDHYDDEDDVDGKKIYLKKLGYVHRMIHDFFLSKGLMVENYK